MDLGQFSTNGTSDITYKTTDSNLPVWVCLLIPFALIVLAALIGLVVHFVLRQRRKSKFRRDAEHGTAGTGRGSSLGAGGIPAIEGLNELGEAPPPYGPDEARKEEEEEGEGAPRVVELYDIREGGRRASRDGREGCVDRGEGGRPVASPPPPAYDAAVCVRTRPTAVAGVSFSVPRA